MALRLRLPRIAEQPDPEVELRPVYVEEWIEALPYANPPALVKALHGALHRLNRSPVKPPARLALLELYTRPYERLLELQENHGPVHTIAALERQRADSDSARRVATELATGYKIVLAHSLGNRSLFGGQKDVRTATQRATVFTSMALLHTFDQYLPTPPDLWTDLHALHASALRDGHDSAGIPMPSRRPGLGLPVASAYRRALLTSLVDPYRLGYGEVWQVYRELEECAEAALVGPYREESRPGGLFLIDPQAPSGPVPYTRIDPGEASARQLLDVNPALAILKQRQERSRDLAASRLRARMIRALSLPPKRHTPRERSEGRVGLATGLSAVHHLLGGDAVEATADPSAEETQGATLDDDDESAVVTYSAEFWELVNQGPGGIGVVKHVRPHRAIGVGEIVGLQTPLAGQSGTTWAVGFVRWLSIADAGEYQAGVQIIAKRATAVSVTVDGDGERSRHRPRRALAVPEFGAEKGATLIAPIGTFAPSVHLHVRIDGHDRRVIAEALSESTSSVERFSYRLVEGQ